MSDATHQPQSARKQHDDQDERANLQRDDSPELGAGALQPLLQEGADAALPPIPGIVRHSVPPLQSAPRPAEAEPNLRVGAVDRAAVEHQSTRRGADWDAEYQRPDPPLARPHLP